ncbi:MAG TPA: hypothetical protein VGJ19_11750 [Streptosporangiaceae bacterium]|jgi:hypothetical protein
MITAPPLVRTDAGASAEQLRAFDWANLGYFELWFGVMGALLIVCASRSDSRWAC